MSMQSVSLNIFDRNEPWLHHQHALSVRREKKLPCQIVLPTEECVAGQPVQEICKGTSICSNVALMILLTPPCHGMLHKRSAVACEFFPV